MRLLRLFCLLWLAIGVFSIASRAEEFHLTNGDVVRGQPVSFDDDGIIVRLDIGGYSPRLGWSKLTQDTLKELLKNPEAAKLAEPFIDEPPPPKEKEKKKLIVLKPVSRVERVQQPDFFASFTTPAGLAIFGALFLANLYAAYEIARFRRRPPALVCGLSVVFPVLAPGLFLAMPSAPPVEGELEPVVEGAAVGHAAGKSTTGSVVAAPAAAGGLSIAHQTKTGGTAAAADAQSYRRGEFTFNRRFFETKFPSFFRVVPNDANLVLVIRAAKEEYTAKRISRISSSDVHVQLAQGGSEVGVPFAQILEVHVRSKA